MNRFVGILALLVFGEHAACGQCPGLSFPHLVDGGGWKSSLYLLNGSATAKASYTIAFRGDAGAPVLLSFSDGRRDNQISGTIAAGGIALVETPGGDNDPLTVASAMLTTGGTLTGFVVIRERQAGGPDREATVSLTTPVDKGLVFPFDNTGGFQSSIALTVPCGGGSMTSLTASAVDEEGMALGHAELKVKGGGHMAFMIGDQLPETRNKRGVVRVAAAGAQAANVYVAGVGLRFTPAGALATMPPSPGTAPAPARPAAKTYRKRTR